VSLPIGAEPCILAFVDRDLAAVIELSVANHAVRDIHVTARPEALQALRAQLGRST
jgi:hypothetical protein